MNSEAELRTEKIALLIGTILGQISEILNLINCGHPGRDYIYNSLLDIHTMAALQVHNVYYKKS